jgi:uncharacterized membrane protein YdjX (TVP38/TMEM64 family)
MSDPTSGLADRPTSRTVRILLRLDATADRRWFLPAVAAFPLTDYVVPIMPNQMLLIGLSVLRPQRWWRLALTFVVAAGTGAFLVATAVQTAGHGLLDLLAGAAAERAAVRETIAAIDRHGLWLLVAVSLLPWPPRTAVLACALVGLPPWAVALAVLLGRSVPAAALAGTGAKAPYLLRRFASIERVLEEVDSRRATRLPRSS